MHIHTYIIGHYNPSVRITEKVSHTTHVVCVNFIREWLDLQFNIDSERQIFEKLFHGRFIYSQSFCQKSTERKSPKKYFSYLIFDDWLGIRVQAFASNEPTLCILDHGDFITHEIGWNYTTEKWKFGYYGCVLARDAMEEHWNDVIDAKHNDIKRAPYTLQDYKVYMT